MYIYFYRPDTEYGNSTQSTKYFLIRDDKLNAKPLQTESSAASTNPLIQVQSKKELKTKLERLSKHQLIKLICDISKDNKAAERHSISSLSDNQSQISKDDFYLNPNSEKKKKLKNIFCKNTKEEKNDTKIISTTFRDRSKHEKKTSIYSEVFNKRVKQLACISKITQSDKTIIDTKMLYHRRKMNKKKLAYIESIK